MTRMSEGQQSYEARRAAKAGLSLEKWLQAKDRDKQAAAPAPAAKPAMRPGLLTRLLDRAHRPLKQTPAK